MTSDLVLRPWSVQDVGQLIEASRDPALRRYTSARVDTVADAVEWVRTQESGWAAGQRFSFAVLDQEEDHLLGNVVLKEFTDDGSAEVGYWTAALARNQGVAPRALELLIDWAFENFGLRRLVLRHQVDNVASCRVAQKCRFEFSHSLTPAPPRFPLEGHLHVRPAGPGASQSTR